MARELGPKVFVWEYFKPGNPVFLKWLIMAVVFKFSSLLYILFTGVILGAAVFLKLNQDKLYVIVLFVILTCLVLILREQCYLLFRPELIIKIL